MADYGGITTEFLNHTRFFLDWRVDSQDVVNNRSAIYWTVGIQGQAGYSAYWYLNAIRIDSSHIGGGGNIASGTWSNKNLYGDQKIGLVSGSKWVGHNSDGSMSIGADIAGWLYGNGTRSASGTWSLPTIPRNSQVTTNAGSYNLGSPVTIYTNRLSDAFSHTITIRLNNSGGPVLKTINSVGGSYTWTPNPTEIATMENAIPSSNTLGIYINSYNNQVGGSSGRQIYLNLKNANPTFSNFTFKDNESSVVAITGSNQVLVKGKSSLRATVSSGNKMVALKGSTANKYDFQYDGSINTKPYSGSTVTSDFSSIISTGIRTITVRAYDSRGNSATVSKTLAVYDYQDPQITSTLIRENNFGSDTTITIGGKYDNLTIGGSKKNVLTSGSLEYRYKESGGSFGSWVTKTFTANTTDQTFAVTPFVLSLDNQKKYDFEFHITDKFGTVTTTAIVDVGKPIMFVGTNAGVGAIGINKMPENGALDVDGDIYSNGGVIGTAGIVQDFAGTTAPTGWLICDGSAVSRSTYANLFTAISTTWGTGDGTTTFNLPNLQRKTIVGSGGTSTATLGSSVGDTGGAETHQLTVGELASHRHDFKKGSTIANGVTDAYKAIWAENSGDGNGGTTSKTLYKDSKQGVQNEGSNTPHNNLQPSAIMLKIIKT